MRELHRQLVETLDPVNAELEPHERISRIIVIRERRTVHNALPMPKLRIRRKAVENRY